MKLRIIKLTPESLAGLLQGKTPGLAGLPSDIEVLDAKMDLSAKQVSLVVRSDSFEDVAEAMPIPELNLSKAPEAKCATKPAAAASTVPTATLTFKSPVAPEVKTSIAKLPQPQTSRVAIKMENEFSPEQRKVLSFTVKGEFVVVKPTQFLKAEWDDINEVVRSLGGRWVKGDIISYWEIPML